jgi:DNA-binding helix-hairpin-helix protein with protein kinase domain
MTPNLYDNLNQRVELGAQLGIGGEGAVFDVVGRPSFVAKVYHNPPDPLHEQKLKLMVTLAQDQLLKVAAWPTATLHRAERGPLVGVLMPKVVGHKEVHTLYSPAHRRKEFPTADWAFLIHTAMNCAAAFDAIHRGGHCVGDVNQSNVLVSPKATVYLIDCDSYQISAGSRTFRCEVGVPLYTPPELQGRNFRSFDRSKDHDRFGLAVLIFHLLFVGRHPFSGRPLTRGELPIEKAIKECRFAFSSGASRLQIALPVHAPPLSILPPGVSGLFERAFGTQSAQPGIRPAAAQWIAALKDLRKQLTTCATDKGHLYSAHLSRCCWCELMQSGAPNYFISVSVFRLGSAVPTLTFVLGPSWAEIDRVPRPSTAYRRPAFSARLLPTALAAHIPARVPPQILISRNMLQTVVGWTGAASLCAIPVAALTVMVSSVNSTASPAPTTGIGVCGFATFSILAAVGFASWWLILEILHQRTVGSANAERNAILADIQDEKRRRYRTYDEARHEFDEVEREWQRTADWYDQSFRQLQRGLGGLKTEFLNLKPRYEEEYRQLERDKEATQRAKFLQTQFISDNEIPGIGPAREAILRSNGIETAQDIDRNRILAIDGFGEVLSGALLAWKEKVTRQFRFNAAAAVERNELAQLVLRYKQAQRRIEVRLPTALAELRACSARAEGHLQHLYARIPRLMEQLAQAKVDLEVLSTEGS